MQSGNCVHFSLMAVWDAACEKCTRKVLAHDSEWCLTQNARQGWRRSRYDLDEPAGRRICCCRHHPECMTAISDYYKLKPECKRAFGVVISPTGEQITMHGGIIRTIKRNFRSFLWCLLCFSLLIVEDKGLRALFQPYFVLLTATIAATTKMRSGLLWKYCQPACQRLIRKSWGIMHPGIFMALTKQLPLQVLG